HKQRENLQKVVAQLEQIGYLQLDFGGAKDKELFKKSKSGDRFFALNEPVALPYYELREVNGKLLVYGGVNQIERQELGEVTQVGLLRGIEALKRYRLSLAAVALTGGPYKFAGRSTMMQKDEPYKLEIQIAYRPKEDELSHLGSEIREDIEQVKRADATADKTLRRRRDK
ncbi:MAG: hypothetical protein K2L20_01020, partial [Ligilactobacillus sp.]|nr:hypothetical protein [Ligilactobacillus sp.]